MDILYPCSLCPQTFTLRKHILKHIKTVHESNDPSMCNDDLKSLLNCSQCHKQFNNQSLLNKHINLNHNISISNLSKNTSRPLEKRVSQKLNAYLLLKVSKHNMYLYYIIAYLMATGHSGIFPPIHNSPQPRGVFFLHNLNFCSALLLNFNSLKILSEIFNNLSYH